MEILVTQTIRPVKLAFLIKPDNQSAFLEAVELSSSLWGGKYFPILQIRTRFTKKFCEEYDCFEKPLEFYSSAIRNFDPDFIVAEDGFQVDFIDKIKGDRKVISPILLKESIEKGEARYGIALDQVLGTVVKNEFKYIRTDGVRLFCPIIKQRDLFSAVLFGRANQTIASSYPTQGKHAIVSKVAISSLSKFYNDSHWFLQSLLKALFADATLIYKPTL